MDPSAPIERPRLIVLTWLAMLFVCRPGCARISAVECAEALQEIAPYAEIASAAGIHPVLFRRLVRFAKEQGRYLLIQPANPASARYFGDQTMRAKPLWVKQKSI